MVGPDKCQRRGRLGRRTPHSDSEEQPKCAPLLPQRGQSCLRLTRQGSRHRFSGEGEAQNGNSGLTLIRRPLYNPFHDSIHVNRFSWYNSVPPHPRIEVPTANENLASYLSRRKRVNRRVNPASQSALRRIAVLGKVPKPEPFRRYPDGAARKVNNWLFPLRRILALVGHLILNHCSAVFLPPSGKGPSAKGACR